MRPPRHRLAATAMPPPYTALARQQAAAWVVRLDAGDLGDEDRAQLQAWLAMDPTHAEALRRARQTWGELDLAVAHEGVTGSATDAWRTPGDRIVAAPPASPRTRRVRRYVARLAASAAVLVVAVGIWQVPRVASTWGADAATGVGQTRRVALAGGGNAQLDTRSAIRLHDSARWREVQVLAGTVSFEVGHGDPRPFRVHVGDSVITDVGTTFQVKRVGASTQVLVASGEVAVASPEGTARLHGGEMVTVGDPDRSLAVSTVDADAAQAWTRGRLVFVDRRLGDVVDELNRYYDGHIVLLGDDVADRQVSGVFRTSDPLAALRVIERNLGLRASEVGLGVIVLRG
ncbi:FecR domain-containing protein [Bacillus sp. NP157]|nr:FecR domain-containing protein [Bacillus sp. NP157]